jgi:hypothetical protein
VWLLTEAAADFLVHSIPFIGSVIDFITLSVEHLFLGAPKFPSKGASSARIKSIWAGILPRLPSAL